MKRTTEKDSTYRHLDKMTTNELLTSINSEDQSVPLAIKKVIPQIESIVDAVFTKMNLSGRLFYIGAGTSGRIRIKLG